MMKYTDLIFDLYGTLVDIHTEESDAVWEKTAIYYGFYGAYYTAVELKEACLTEISRLEKEAGLSEECFPDIPCDTVMSDLFRKKGVIHHADALGKNAAQLFRILSIEYIKLYPYVPEALTQLRKNGYRLWLLSNAQRIFTAYELRHLGLTDYFDGIYISSDYGCRKPDIRFFRALIHERNLNTETCLMIGNDRLTDIAGAKNAGVDILYMHTNLTPQDQQPANPVFIPGKKTGRCNHYEFEGTDWCKLVRLILNL